MGKLVVLGIACATALFSTAAIAQHRGYAPAQQHYQAPVQQYHPGAQVRINPGMQMRVNPGMPGHQLGQLGGHGLPMVQGLRGWHETHNRTHLFRTVPGQPLVDGDFGPEADFDTFVDSIDVSTPLEAIDPCSDLCNMFAAISIASDGIAGWSWTAPTVDAA